ncbi:MAG: CocE/NonD family hydrolase, partial [Parasporobacterium sp.]|nr:CocE/NonD family hydrolase [Parasporobacterium sp.]
MCAALNYEVIEQRIRGEYSRLDMPEIYSGFHCDEFYLPMKDGVGLKTYIYRGENVPEPAPVILQRSPYVHLMPLYKTHGECLAKRGFIYVLQFCRGTGGSEGQWEPNVNEPEDGIDTVNWLEGCDWAGNIGFWGSSYLALTGWCIADKLPSKVKGMYLAAYGTNRFVSAYEKNLFRHDVLTSWTMENAGFPVTADYMESCMFRPHVEVDKTLWGKEIPWYREMVSAPSGNEQYWHQGFWLHLRDIPSKMNIPIIIREGWYDHHLGSSLTSYESLSEEQRKKTTLLIGCWNHINANCIEWMEPVNLKNSETESMVPFMKSLL